MPDETLTLDDLRQLPEHSIVRVHLKGRWFYWSKRGGDRWMSADIRDGEGVGVGGVSGSYVPAEALAAAAPELVHRGGEAKV